MEDLVDFIIGLKSPADIASFTNRLSCLYLLLVYALKVELLYVLSINCIAISIFI